MDGDDRAELTALHTSGTAYTYNGVDAAVKTTAFGGGMNSSLFDGTGHHVIDTSDVDADGNSDLITLGSNGAVNVYPGQSDRSFGTGVIATSITPGTMGPSGHEPIGVADVTGDKRGDLVTFYAPQKNFYVYPGQEGNTFGPGITMGGGYLDSAAFDRQGAYYLDVADANGDEYADVTATSAYPWASSLNVDVYRGGPSGIRQQSPELGPNLDLSLGDGSGHEPLGVADVDGDGKSDLVTLNSSGSVSVYAGSDTHIESTGSYRFFAESAVTSLSGLNSSLMDGTGDDFVGLIDRSGDGKADLVKVASDGTVQIAPGEGTLKFGAFATFKTGVTSNRFAISPGYEMVQEKPFIRRVGCSAIGCTGRPQPTESDVDGDRRSDLVTVDTTGVAHTFRAVGAGTPEATSFAGSMDSALYDGTGHHVIDTADVTGDRLSDLITLASGTINVYPGRADGSFLHAPITSLSGTITPGPFSTAEGYEPIAVSDVTGDTKADLVLFKAGQGVKVYPANSGGNGTFGTAKTSLTTINSALWDNAGTSFFDLADVNGDLRADLVTDENVYKGQADGSFATGVSTGVPSSERLGLGDVNGDGLADLALANGTSVKVYAGTTNGDFKGSSATSVNGFDSSLLDGQGEEFAGLLDQNGDKRYDLVSVHADGSAKVYRGREDLTFASPITYPLPGFTPNRYNQVPGHEVVNEKPLKTRAGACSPEKGCQWPPITIDSDVDGNRRADIVSVRTDGAAFVNGEYATDVGTVDPALYYGVGQYLVDAADVDGDGRSDLVTMGSEGELQVRRGKPNGSLAKFDNDYAGSGSGYIDPVYSGEGSFEPIAAADVDDDGRADVIGLDGSEILTLRGQANRTFDAPVSSLSGSVGSPTFDGTGDYFLDAIDVTGDGRADLVSMNSSGSVLVYKGQVDGGFSGVATTPSINPVLDDGSGQEPIGLGDVNADGRADLVTLSGGYVKLHLANTDGTFTTQGGNATSFTIDSSLMDGSGLTLIGMLDISDDGRSDIVMATATGSLYNYVAQSNNTFASASVLSGYAATPPVAHRHIPGHEFTAEKPLVTHLGCAPSGCRWPSITPGVDSDVDGDRRADLTTIHSSGGVEVFRGDPLEIGNIPTDEPIASLGSMNSATQDGSGDYAIDTADVTGDGISDLVTIKATGGLYVHPGSESGSFGTGVQSLGTTKPVQVSGGTYEPIAVADVTGDGYADLVNFAKIFGTSTLITHKGQASGAFATSGQFSQQNVANSALLDGTGDYFIDAADVTGDGLADLVAMSDSGVPRVFAGQSGATFAAATSTTAFTLNSIADDGQGHEPLGVADVDRDKLADLVVAHSESGAVLVFRGLSNGTFALPENWGNVPPALSDVDSSLTDGFGEELIGLLDYNSDARADLVAVSTDQDVLAYPAQTDSTFGDPQVSGPLASNQFNFAPGYEFVNEKPSWRRKPSVVPASSPAGWSLETVSPASLSPADVSCTSTSHCVAVGEDEEGSESEAALWNGTSWSAMSVPDPEGASASELSGVSCVTSTNCTAVGSYVEEEEATKKLVVKWDGSTWSLVTTPNPSEASSSELAGISCPTATYCAAVGSYVKDGTTRSLGVVWNGSAWSVPTTPHPSGSTSSELADIHCYANASCLAGGDYVDGEGVRSLMLVNTFFGVWAKMNPPTPSGALSSELADVTCPVYSSCKAAGNYVDSEGRRRTLLMHGPVSTSSEWSIVASPDPAWSASNQLSGISCNSSTVCVAVGRAVAAGAEHSLLAILQSGKWRSQPASVPSGTDESRLEAVSCTGTSDCRVVGEAELESGPTPFALRR